MSSPNKIFNDVGDLSKLPTVDKSSLVNSISEIDKKVNANIDSLIYVEDNVSLVNLRQITTGVSNISILQNKVIKVKAIIAGTSASMIKIDDFGTFTIRAPQNDKTSYTTTLPDNWVNIGQVYEGIINGTFFDLLYVNSVVDIKGLVQGQVTKTITLAASSWATSSSVFRYECYVADNNVLQKSFVTASTIENVNNIFDIKFLKSEIQEVDGGFYIYADSKPLNDISVEYIINGGKY